MNLNCLLFKCVILFLASLNVSGQQACTNCCQNYRKIDNPRRSVQSQWKSGQVPLCDKDLVAGWYRFTSFVGGKMPTAKVNLNHCGTKSPIWLDGTTGNHPTNTNDPVARIKACVNVNGRRGGCFYPFSVSVKYCAGNFYVYYLQPTYSCYAAYCAGGTVKFPSKQFLCCPKITFRVEPDDIEPVSLYCIVPIDEKIMHWNDVTYEIEWFVDGKKAYTEKPFCRPPGGQTKNKNPCPGDKEIRSLLTANRYEPGQWISCEVKARFTTSAAHPWSDAISVKKLFFAGIKVTPSTIVIEECKEPFHKELTLTPMIPVRKALSVKFYLPDGLWLLNRDDCTVTLKGTDPVKVKVGATCTTLYGLAKSKVITPKIMNKDDSLFWGHFGLPTVWVTVLQKDGPLHKCKCVTDPHYRMLDKQNVERWYDFFGHGDFVLYRNKEKNFEVQTRQWSCNYARSVTCNCGVIIRDHNDLIRFSCCGDPPKKDRDSTTPINVDIPRAKCLAPGITLNQLIKGINSKYEVIVPTGIRVVLERNYWGIDVTIYTPRTKNRADEEGLCTFDQHRHGDIYTFGYKYRKFPSYFDQLPPQINRNSDGTKYEKACACDETKDKGTTKKCAENGIPVNWQSFEKDKYNRIKMCDRDPKKREAEGSDEITEEDYELFMKPIETVVHNRQKRSVTNITKENATRYCSERLAETPVGKMCAKIGTNVQALVNVCSSDIEYTGDLSFAIGAVSMLMNECDDVIIEKFTVNSNVTSNETTPTIPPMVETIAQLLCPNDCTFNGKCVNGSCVCNKDHTAEDCSISIYQKPNIVRLQGHGLCDTRKRACKRVAVQGTGFLNSTNMTCHITETEIVNSSWIPNKYESKYPGIMTDLVLVECFLPESPVLQMQYDEKNEGTPAAGLMISVSNNGVHKSKQQLKLISFDSVCMECNVSTGCSLKKNSCFINRYCFAPNEPNPKDWCQQCLPKVETNRWTKRQVNHPPNVTSITDYYVVYGEKLELPIEATDPEGMPITITLMKGSPKEALMQNNILLWNVTTNKTTQFFFKATDACQASSTLNITITVNVCQCNNSGLCIPRRPRGRGYYVCNCAPGFTGQYCNTEVDECESFPCLRGRCIDHVNNYTCSCDLGFEGRNCDVDIDYCKSSPCVYGSCTDQVNEYTCSCKPGYIGKRCETNIDKCGSSPCSRTDVDDCVHHACANGGSCVDGISSYSCKCMPGFTGERCDTITSVTPSTATKESPTIPTSSNDVAREHSFEISIKEEWKQEYADKTSNAFKNLAAILTNLIEQAFAGNLREVTILSLRKGSILAKFKLIFETDVNEQEAKAPLQKAIEDGELGRFKVDPGSLKATDNEAGTKRFKSGGQAEIPFAVVIGASCGGAFVLCLFTVCAVRLYKRRGSRDPSVVTDGMPAEAVLPTPEKYELKDTKPKEDIVHREEIGIWNKALME